MKSKIKVIVIGLIILCLAGVYAIIDKAVSIYDTSCDTSAFQSITLEQGKKLEQSFVCKENGWYFVESCGRWSFGQEPGDNGV